MPIPPSLGRLLTAHKTQAFKHGHAKPDDLVVCSLNGGTLGHRNVGRRGLEKALEAAWVAAPALARSPPRLRVRDDLPGRERRLPVAAARAREPLITLSMYAHQFASAEHAANTREQMEAAFGGLL